MQRRDAADTSPEPTAPEAPPNPERASGDDEDSSSDSSDFKEQEDEDDFEFINNIYDQSERRNHRSMPGSRDAVGPSAVGRPDDAVPMHNPVHLLPSINAQGQPAADPEALPHAQRAQAYRQAQDQSRRRRVREWEDEEAAEDEDEAEDEEVAAVGADDEVKGSGEAEDEFVYLRLQPGENSWGLGAEHMEHLQGGGGGGGNDDDDEEDGADNNGAPADKDFCPICAQNLQPGSIETVNELFLMLLEYGRSDLQQFAKTVSRFYNRNIQYSLVDDPAMQKPWHWRSVLNHCRNHSGSAVVFTQDQIAVISRLLEVASSNMVRIKKAKLDEVVSRCTRPSDISRMLMREASVEPGTIAELQKLVSMRRQLMDQYNKSYESAKKDINTAKQQKQAEASARRTEKKNKRAKTTHEEQVQTYISNADGAVEDAVQGLMQSSGF